MSSSPSSEAESLKNQGNQAFSKKEYSKAISYYSEGLDHDPENSTIYSNRSGSYCALGKYEQAAADAKKAIEFRPDWVRGYTRLGAALQGEQDWSSAEKAFEKALELDPDNANIKGDLTEVRRNKDYEDSQDEISSSSITHIFNEENLKKISMLNPEFKDLIQEGEIRSIINEIRNNSKKLGEYYGNPVFMQILTAILTLDVQNSSNFSRKEEAEQEKTQGNESFKNGKYEEALQHYNKAILFDHFNITYYNNKATVLNKLGKFNEAILVCDEALKKAKECNAPQETVAKTYQKVAAAQNSLGNIQEAIDALNTSLAAKKDVQVQKEIRRLEAALERKKIKDYENPELAEKAQKEGNDYVKRNEFTKAIDFFNEAIKRAPRNAIYYTDRANCYTKLNDFSRAMNDCNKALELDPKCAMALIRKGHCHFAQKEIMRARECFKDALNMSPGNMDAINGIRLVSQQIESQKDQEPDEEQIRRHMQDPEIQRILQDPKMKKILAHCKRDPKMFKEYYNDPEVAENFKKLQAAGILR